MSKLRGIKSIISKAWDRLLSFINAVFLIVTCFIVYGAIIFVIYNTFISFSLGKAVVGCLIICVMLHTNKNLQ